MTRLLLILLMVVTTLPAQKRIRMSNLSNRHALPGRGMVLAYDMTTGSGQTIVDRTRQGRDGQLGAIAGTDSADPNWITGGGLDFAAGDYARLPAISQLDFDGVPFTILVRFATDASTTTPLVTRGAHNSGAPFGGWAFRHADGGGTIITRTSAGAVGYTYTNATTFTIGTKYLYGWSGTYRESAGTSAGIAYRDGAVLSGTETNTTTNTGDSSVFTPALGAVQAGTGSYVATFNGQMYMVAIWNRALTAADHAWAERAMQ